MQEFSVEKRCDIIFTILIPSKAWQKLISPAGLRTYGRIPPTEAGISFLLTVASQPLSGQCSMTVFVPIYRCGTVPDFHRIPFFRIQALKRPGDPTGNDALLSRSI
jgi:hypothetical protein